MDQGSDVGIGFQAGSVTVAGDVAVRRGPDPPTTVRGGSHAVRDALGSYRVVVLCEDGEHLLVKAARGVVPKVLGGGMHADAALREVLPQPQILEDVPAPALNLVEDHAVDLTTRRAIR
ncbi:MAG: hypothetical protein AAGD06_24320 [Acidobacteriota bacterium]